MFEDIRDYRKIYSIRSVLGVSHNKKWMSCPMPQHHRSGKKQSTPSFSIFYDNDGNERWKCHGNCGLHGDVIDLVGYINVAGYDPKNIRSVLRAVAILGNKFDIKMPDPPPPKRLLVQDKWAEYFPPDEEVYRYGARRGLYRTTMDKFRIGQKDTYMAMPCFEEERLVGIKFRNTKAYGLRFFTEAGGRKGLFNYDNVAWTKEKVLIVKGEIPVMLLDQYGILACAPTAGEGSVAEEYAPVLGLAAKRIVVGDNDDDAEVRLKMQEAALDRANAMHAILQFPPMEFKDIDQWIMSDIFAIGTIKGWLNDNQ
jgi:hypothetical protein